MTTYRDELATELKCSPSTKPEIDEASDGGTFESEVLARVLNPAACNTFTARELFCEWRVEQLRARAATEGGGSQNAAVQDL